MGVEATPPASGGRTDFYDGSYCGIAEEWRFLKAISSRQGPTLGQVAPSARKVVSELLGLLFFH